MCAKDTDRIVNSLDPDLSVKNGTCFGFIPCSVLNNSIWRLFYFDKALQDYFSLVLILSEL